jgi:diaminopimelate epimerase
MGAIQFAKGHGTQNDFVVLPDLEGTLDLTPARVRALCDRQQGLGADGLLRVVRAAAIPDLPATIPGDTWFMDYRNSDGSIAEMCGNGVRVFARYLVDAGLADTGNLIIGTRAGLRPTVVHQDGTVTVDMGPATILGRSTATVEGEAFTGVAVDVGNPHLACLVDTDITGFDLTVPPGHDPMLFPHGVNVEFMNQAGPGVLRMRVHERGVGETRSCGTGTVAAVAAALHLKGQPQGESVVDVPGGRVWVTVTPETSTLTGPAVLVARGELDRGWWDSLADPAEG